MLTLKEIDRLVEDKHMADFFEAVLAECEKIGIYKRGKHESSSRK